MKRNLIRCAFDQLPIDCTIDGITGNSATVREDSYLRVEESSILLSKDHGKFVLMSDGAGT